MDKENSMNLASLLDFTHFFFRGVGGGGRKKLYSLEHIRLDLYQLILQYT